MAEDQRDKCVNTIDVMFNVDRFCQKISGDITRIIGKDLAQLLAESFRECWHPTNYKHQTKISTPIW